ncbi:MAG: NupC/NupG family nucleoside CNT transporter [Oligoflexus sp.]
MERLLSFCGLFILIGVAWLFSTNRRKFDFRVVGGGLLLQFLCAVFILKTDLGQMLFAWARDTVTIIISLSDAGAEFVFGADFREHFFAFKVLPTIIFASTLSYILFYLGVMQKFIGFMAWVMKRVMNISGAESLVSAANIFLGQTEAPLFIKPYLKTMTRSEIMVMMTGGMATVAGGVLAAYVGYGVSAGHLLAASLMSAPAAILIAKVMVPETEESPTFGTIAVKVKAEEVNIFEAACKGAAEGLKLALNVGAMLIAFIALVSMINLVIAAIAAPFGAELTLQIILGRIFQPLAFLLGISWQESFIVGQLLGTKIVINEFLAFIELANYIDGDLQGQLSERAITLSTYALCGFANFSSIAIQIGGIGSLEPSRKSDFAINGLRAMIGGTIAAMMTACVAGILI